MTNPPEADQTLSSPEVLLPTASGNGRPLASHDRQIEDQTDRENHIEHVRDMDALCMVCGCCWCCRDDCCAEYVCPNPDCGCNDKPVGRLVVPSGVDSGGASE